jgi:hypothetical protein
MKHQRLQTAAMALSVMCLAAAPAPARALAHDADNAGGHRTMSAARAETDSKRALRDGMHKLWSDHVIWTREYIIGAVDGTPDVKAATARLLKNQDDIGNAIVPYYGKAAGDQLTSLLKQHILIAVDLIDAAKSGNQARFKENNQKWSDNARSIAAFLAKANPNWPEAALVDAMNMHLQTTTNEVSARLNKKYDDDVAAFDAVFTHILKMADTLADGIIAQFPDKFAN